MVLQKLKNDTKVDMDMGNLGKLRKAVLWEGIKTYLTDLYCILY